MRTECKNYESRTYANGDAVRKCNLDLAPEAPWRCPDPCEGYARRLPGLDDGSAAAVLDAASEIINSISAKTIEEVVAEQSKKRRWWRKKK